ncbi:hypothetical protein SERLA73DRAFT_163038 [Serpula lacrymans var. lacrymans S7.3]|uniref:Cleavage/polyadenylation specificity factor A subunit N-terminal domain-containing protein n=1 Tax=Serpula lacrymans var. lacrymans (strain S7.3) TaxID=936435 RepID=F8QB61_SERL3|nr:hypothetical protein SERLA73DRAFT_163038 [Serpula lacrymans var. lacrymans S7.3]
MLWMLPPIDADTRLMEVTRSAIYVMPIRIEGVAIDVTQNLSALVARAPPGYHIYLRTVDKNVQHPLAPEPVLLPTQLPTGQWEPYDVKVKILGQSLVFLGLDLQRENSIVGETLQIWNWQEADNAEPQCVITKAEVDDNILDFCFLAHDALLLLTTSGVLEVYTFSEFATPVCKARYALPKIRPGFKCSRGDGFIICNFPCVATAATRRSVDSSKLIVLPFCPNPQDRICAVSFGYVFYIDMQSLFTSGGVAPTSGNGTETSVLAWSAWGPQNSRCFPNDGVYDVHGSRAVGISRIGGRTYRLRMREFNPYAIRRTSAVGDNYQWLVTEPSRIPPGWAFAEEVVTYLPYREAFSYEWFDEFDSTFQVSVDDSRLVLVQKLDVANNININFQTRIVLFKFCSARDAKI